MLISCPNCSTKFAVPISAIGTTGRKVKCTKCAHIWFQEPVSAKLESLLKVEYSPPTHLPAKRKSKIKVAYAASLALLIFLSGTLEILKHTEKFPGLTRTIGINNYDGLRFHNIKLLSELVDNKMRYSLSGSIVNLTDRQIKLPPIHVKIYSKGGRSMGESKIAMTEPFLEPYEQMNINPEVTGVSGNADKVELSFENGLESSFR